MPWPGDERDCLECGARVVWHQVGRKLGRGFWIDPGSVIDEWGYVPMHRCDPVQRTLYRTARQSAEMAQAFAVRLAELEERITRQHEETPPPARAAAPRESAPPPAAPRQTTPRPQDGWLLAGNGSRNGARPAPRPPPPNGGAVEL